MLVRLCVQESISKCVCVHACILVRLCVQESVNTIVCVCVCVQVVQYWSTPVLTSGPLTSQGFTRGLQEKAFSQEMRLLACS